MWPFTKKSVEPKPPTMLEVGKVTVTINGREGEQWKMEFVGQGMGFGLFGNDGELIASAEQYFLAWERQNGERGTVHLGNGLYVPFWRIMSYTCLAEKHQVPSTMA